MNALVTGGGGFLGRYVVEQLLAAGAKVRVYSRRRFPELEAQGVVSLAGDLRDAGRVADACQGVDTVFHTAAVPGIWGPWSLYYETNVVGTQNVIAGCVASGVARLVYTSSPSVVYDGRPHEGADESLPFPDHFSAHYPKSKALAEQAVLAANGSAGLRTIALRPHLIWGPRDNHLLPRLIQRARLGRLRQVGDGRNKVSMSYVENTAHAHLLAASALSEGRACAGKAYFINEPEPVVLWAWVNQLLAAAGLPPVRGKVPTSVAWMAGAGLEAVARLMRSKNEPIMTRFLASQLSSSHWYRIDAAARDFGYGPVVSAEEGLRRTTPDLRRWAGGG
ncbi:3 beta-hydroxysteroid dehydrogenase/Delta 5--_4-isomerase [Caulifigura coniformis]|uniref:3 beta-hydroxysteroid dehydrogenase/Delta 5-->4-isomerase n=1 Tax=Caulifigura coniformis TaxID=2527983 RepID=A0A517SGT5_9PLAN|nr:NAD-dependent epimerase/dehydratase family protein [Caulifigura coniformis]QDT55339.1 3 beta-hydroxysteroid dehydrogenase/Delta 5-->4-isomerase [Caulifigura coniformis]